MLTKTAIFIASKQEKTNIIKYNSYSNLNNYFLHFKYFVISIKIKQEPWYTYVTWNYLSICPDFGNNKTHLA